MSASIRYVVIAVAAWLLGLAWAISSPIGSSPDDNFHLTSIWCATNNADACVVTDGQAPDIEALVPVQLFNQGCFAFQQQVSGACVDVPDDTLGAANWFNVGLYPPVFYRAMSIFVGSDIWRSIVVMRMASMTAVIALFGLAAWVARPLRTSQLVAWSVAAIPLGIFLFASTNPSGWGIAGVAAMWPATYALVTAASWLDGAKAFGVMALAAVAASARGDTAAMASVVAVATVAIFWARGTTRIAQVLAALAVSCLLAAVFLSSSQTASLQEGLDSDLIGSGMTLLWNNILQLPSLWAAAFGVTFSLGWFDTVMPPLAWFPVFAAVSGLVLIGVARAGIRRGLLLGVVAGMAVVLPLLLLQRSGAAVGDLVQPRYILPLVFVFVGVALAPLERPLMLTGQQRWLLTLLMSLAASAALHVQLRRYVTGTDVVSPNLNLNPEWTVPVLSPMAIWALGTLASCTLFAVVFSLLHTRNRSTTAAGDGDPPAEAAEAEAGLPGDEAHSPAVAS